VRIVSTSIFFIAVLLFFSPMLPKIAGNGATGYCPLNGTAWGDSLTISLKEAVFLALEKNPTVTIQRHAPDITRSFAAERRSVFDPKLSASTSKSISKTKRFLGAQRTPYDMDIKQTQYNIKISETLPTGTTVTATSAMSGTTSSIFEPQYAGSMGLTINQALLQGFWFNANYAAVRKANLEVEISQSELKAVAEQLVANVEKAYWDMYLAAEEIAIQNKSLELANRQLHESQERVAVGRLPELELAAVHAEVALRRGALIDAQSKYEQARLHFLYLLNPAGSADWETVPVPADKPTVPGDSLDTIAEHEMLGMKFRPDLEQARLSLKKSELDIVQTKDGLLPRLDVFITFGRTSYAKTLRDALPGYESQFYETTSGVTFALPVPNRAAKAQHLRAQRSKKQMELSVQNMEKMVQWDIRSAYLEVMRSKQQIEATRISRQLQERKLDAELEKFRVGKSTNYLVLQAQRDLVASQLVEVRSTVSYLNALVDLYQMEGTLLERRGITCPSEL
jgi:outer membrane protein TolC